MLEGSRTILFIKPLSPMMESIQMQLQENKADQNLNIFIVEKKTEAARFVKAFGPVLIIFSSPKQTLLILQAIRKNIRETGSKSLLLSPKKLPQKVIETAENFGLNQLLVEPIPMKTISFKLNLLLKSIRPKQAEEKLIGDKLEIKRTPQEDNEKTENGKSLREEKLEIKSLKTEDDQASKEPDVQTISDKTSMGKLEPFDKKEKEKKHEEYVDAVDEKFKSLEGKIDDLAERLEEKKKSIEEGLSPQEKNNQATEVIDYREIYNQYTDIDKKYYKTNLSDGAAISKVAEDKNDLSHRKIIKPEPQGLDNIIFISYLYFLFKNESHHSSHNTKNRNIIFRYLSRMIQERYSGKTIFFVYKKKTNSHEELYDYHEDATNEEDILKWKEEKQATKDRWVKEKIPTWSDEHCREMKLDFVYPVFEGMEKLGLVGVTFEWGFKQKDQLVLEALLDTIRGIYIEMIFNEDQNKKDEKDAA